MPKGAPVPIKRELVARIGPPLCVADLRRLTVGLTPAEAAREVLADRAGGGVGAARRPGARPDAGADGGGVGPENPLIELFAELETKFRAGEVEKPVSYYVSLGNDDLAKWTVRVDAAEVRLHGQAAGRRGRLRQAGIFAKIVRESYVPTPGDFMSGVFKSNDVALLATFQRVFQLDQPS